MVEDSSEVEQFCGDKVQGMAGGTVKGPWNLRSEKSNEQSIHENIQSFAYSSKSLK